jgi:hypothetical protein
MLFRAMMESGLSAIKRIPLHKMLCRSESRFRTKRDAANATMLIASDATTKWSIRFYRG